MTISERIEAARRERRVLTRVSRAACRLEQAKRERVWGAGLGPRRGISIRSLATAIGLSPSRVHQLVAVADLGALDAALGEPRAAGWPAPEDPDSGEDTELGGRDTSADRLSDEVSWLRQCADWLAHLDAESYPPAVNLRPSADWPDRAIVAVDQAAPGEPAPGISAASRPGGVSGRVMKPSPSGGTRPARTGHAPPGTWLPVGPAGCAWPSAGVNP